MAPAYTRRLAASWKSASGTAMIYSAPSTGTVVLRDIILTNTGSAPCGIALYMAEQQSEDPAPRAPGYFYLVTTDAFPAQSVQRLELRQVIAYPEHLFFASSAPAVSVLVTGYVFGA